MVAGPLPGQTPVVLDPALGWAIDVVPREDGHAQERSLPGPILETVAGNDVRVADRNFCTARFPFGIAGRKGSSRSVGTPRPRVGTGSRSGSVGRTRGRWTNGRFG